MNSELIKNGILRTEFENGPALQAVLNEKRGSGELRVIHLLFRRDFEGVGDTSISADLLGDLDVPVVSTVTGKVDGDALIAALSSHLCFSEADASFDFRTLALSIDFGGFPNRPRIVAPTELLSNGLINGPLGQGDAVSIADRVVSTIAERAPMAIKATLESVRNLSLKGSEEGFEKELELFAGLFETNDMRLGTKAFLAKEKPSFKGN
ncbi:MAG: hypothetical protein HKN33_14445 [Pyrinomonadaceae bacterium]|nr:hypothetical protein [Pyrinomonadaceae bacterium]